jgi:hypothetical protein
MLKKRNLIFLSLLILGILLLTSCFLNSPATEGILKGQIMVPEGSIQAKDLTGQALPDATVNIIDLSTGAIIATTTTDATGHYQVSVPPGGPYLLEAVKDGIKIQQITCQVEVGIEYDLGTADCATTAAALIAQAMMDAGANPADINLADIEADPNFDEVVSSVTSVIQAGGNPTTSAAVEQAVEDFLNPSAPINIPEIPGVTAPVTGETPVTAIIATDQYTGTVAWEPADDPFLGSTPYTATITLTAEAGFTLNGVAADFFTVEGAAATNPADSGVVTAVFSATAAVVNGDFETGDFTGWTVIESDQFPQVQDTEVYSGSSAAYMGDGAEGLDAPGDNTASIQQTVYIPSYAVNPELFIYYLVDGDDGDYCNEYDNMKFYINGTEILCVWEDTDGWQQFQYSLNAYIDTSIILKISSWTDDDEVTVNYYVDDIAITWD